jgi:hypothetical protein
MNISSFTSPITYYRVYEAGVTVPVGATLSLPNLNRYQVYNTRAYGGGMTSVGGVMPDMSGATALQYFEISNNNLIAMRIELNLAAENEHIAQSFYNQMSLINNSSPPILIGFKAISILIMGKHAFNPYTKLKHF